MQIDKSQLIEKGPGIDPTASYVTPFKINNEYLNFLIKNGLKESIADDISSQFYSNCNRSILIAGESGIDDKISESVAELIRSDINYNKDIDKEKIHHQTFRKNDAGIYEAENEINNGSLIVYWVSAVFDPDRYILNEGDGRYNGLIHAVEKNEFHVPKPRLNDDGSISYQSGKENGQDEIYKTELIKPIISFDFLKGSERAKDLCISPELSIDESKIKAYSKNNIHMSHEDLIEDPQKYSSKYILHMNEAEKLQLKDEMLNLSLIKLANFIEKYESVLKFRFGNNLLSIYNRNEEVRKNVLQKAS